MSEPTYDYAAKGNADALAGRKDLRLYDDMVSKHAEAYRNGWREGHHEVLMATPEAAQEIHQEAQPVIEAISAPPAPSEPRHDQNPAAKQAPADRSRQEKPAQLDLF